MSFIFNITAKFLAFIAALTGFTYKEINILVYYFLIPLLLAVLIDKALKKHIFKGIYTCSLFLLIRRIDNFRKFSESLFDSSVLFLKSFSAIGWNYVTASVITCVVLPGALLLLGSYYAFKNTGNKTKKNNQKPLHS